MTSRRPLRVGVVADLLEEGWPSMDLVAEMLTTHLRATHVDPVLLRPSLKRRLSHLAGVNGRSLVTDRIVNRFWDYPGWLRSRITDADVFHVVDHSYAHLARVLPAGRIVITCHDTDAFRPLVDSGPQESKLPRFLVRRILEGLRKADVVACVSETTRQELLEWNLVDESRAEVVPNGVDECYSPEPDPTADRIADGLLGNARSVDLIHVGSTIPRKRIEVLLRVFHLLREQVPDVRLVRVGGAFTSEQHRLASELGLSDRILQLPFLERPVLAAVYRRSVVALLPSEREGFGLPLVEAMASGTPVVATSIPVLEEVGGPAGVYVPLGDIRAWSDTILDLLRERTERPAAWADRRAACQRRAAGYSWSRNASRMTEIYERLAGR